MRARHEVIESSESSRASESRRAGELGSRNLSFNSFSKSNRRRRRARRSHAALDLLGHILVSAPAAVLRGKMPERRRLLWARHVAAVKLTHSTLVGRARGHHTVPRSTVVACTPGRRQRAAACSVVRRRVSSCRRAKALLLLPLHVLELLLRGRERAARDGRLLPTTRSSGELLRRAICIHSKGRPAIGAPALLVLAYRRVRVREAACLSESHRAHLVGVTFGQWRRRITVAVYTGAVCTAAAVAVPVIYGPRHAARDG